MSSHNHRDHAMAAALIRATEKAITNARDGLSRWADHVEQRRAAGLDVADDETRLAYSIVTTGRQVVDLDGRAGALRAAKYRETAA